MVVLEVKFESHYGGVMCGVTEEIAGCGSVDTASDQESLYEQPRNSVKSFLGDDKLFSRASPN